MYLTFFKFELNPLDNKKDIGLYVLFRTFQVNFQDISVTRSNDVCFKQRR